MSNASTAHGHTTSAVVDPHRYGSGQRRPRRGPDTGIFKRFDLVAAGLESLATKRSSSAPPTPRTVPPPRPPMIIPLPRASMDISQAALDLIEEISCVEDPPIVQRPSRPSRP